MTPHPTHPASLRIASADDTQSAIASAWREHRRWVATVLLAHKPREIELEDLLQEVAVRFVAHAHDLRDPTAIKPWLRTVAINTARSAGRKQSVRREARRTLELNAHTQTRDHQANPSNDVLEAARQLPEAYREPLLLRSLRGMSYKQIADTLEVPVTTIETRLVRARRMLKDALERLHEAPDRSTPTDHSPPTEPRTQTEDPS